MALDMDRWRALVKTVMHIRVPLNAGYFLIGSGTVSFTERTPLQVVRLFVSFSQLVT